MIFFRSKEISFLLLLLLFPVAYTIAQESEQPKIDNVQATADALFFDAIREKQKNNLKKADSLLQKFIQIRPNVAAAYYNLSGITLNTDPDKSLTYIKKAVALEPGNVWYKQQLADIYAYSNQYKEAADLYADLAKWTDRNEDYLLNAANFYQRAGMNKEALSAFDKLVAKAGDDDEVLLQQQQLYLKMNDVEGAAGAIKKLIKNNPTEGKYYALLAEIYYNNKQTEKAAEVYKQAEKLFPDEPEVQLSLATFYLKEKNEAKYNEFFERAITNKVLDAESQLGLLIAYMRNAGDDKDKRAKSVALAKKIVEQNANSAIVYSIYGDILAINEERALATEQYKKAVVIDPSSYTTWQNMLYGYVERPYADSLIIYSEKALRLFPNQAMLHYLNGIGHLNKRNYSKAIKSIERAIEMQPDENVSLLADMYSSLGDAYNITKQYALSDSNLEKALKLDPENASVLNNYSYYLSVRGARLDEAEKMSKRSLEIRPDEATFLDTYGWILYKQGKYEKAREYLQKAVDKSGANADGTLWEHLGDVHYKLKDTNKAVEYWIKAKERGTDSENIDKKIKDKKLYE
jgi:tetratricopeptide (TPR) repeat protein